MNILLSVIFSIIACFLIVIMTPPRGEEFHLRAMDVFVSVGIVFVAVHLLWHMLARPSWRDAVAFYLRYEGSFLGQISFWTVSILYFFGIYIAIKWVTKSLTERLVGYATVGIFLFALSMFVIFVILLGG